MARANRCCQVRVRRCGNSNVSAGSVATGTKEDGRREASIVCGFGLRQWIACVYFVIRGSSGNGNRFAEKGNLGHVSGEHQIKGIITDGLLFLE